MERPHRAGAPLPVWVAALLVLGLAAVGQAAGYTLFDHDMPDAAPYLDIRYRVIPEKLERGSEGVFGYVAVRVRNDSAEPRMLDLSLKSWAMPISRFSNHRAVQLEPGETRFIPLLSPSLRDGIRLVVEVEGRELGKSSSFFHAPWRGRATRPLTILAICGAARASDWNEAIEHVTTDLSGPDAIAELEWTAIEPRELPASWRALTGCEVVLLDPSAPGLTGDHVRLLVAYVAGGGSLLVARAEAATASSLRVLWTNGLHQGDGAAAKAIESGAPLVTGRYGLGRWATVRGDAEDLGTEITPPANGPPGVDRWLSGQNKPWRDRLPRDLLETLDVPGVGAIPVRGFTALIIVYVLLVGPVSFVFFKRRDGRPTRAVVLAPLVGLGLTIAILGYGFFGEGTAVRHAVYSVTFLDQTQHTATTIASRTVYAGFAPSSGVAPGAETHVTRHERLDRRQQRELETTRGLRLLGDTLPSRMPTGFTSVSHTRARPRLRFRRVGQELELLADEALQPVKGRPVLVRTRDGTVYVRRANGRLSPASPEETSLAVTAILSMHDTEPTHYVVAPRLWPRLCGTSPREGIDAPLPPGTYLLEVQAAPALDGLGLGAQEVYGHHVVYGTLGKEDLLDR